MLKLKCKTRRNDDKVTAMCDTVNIIKICLTDKDSILYKSLYNYNKKICYRIFETFLY